MQDGTQYYLEVEEVMADPVSWDGKPLQVHGYAANVMRRPKSLDYRFEIAESVGGRTHVLNAVYTGIVPDTFDNHAEVVATGRLGRRHAVHRRRRHHGQVPVEVRREAGGCGRVRFRRRQRGQQLIADSSPGAVPDDTMSRAGVSRESGTEIRHHKVRGRTPMATLGSYTLLAAFVACAYAAAAVVAGHRRHSARLVESGIGSFYLVTALMTLASAIIVRAFVIGDYSIRYVDRYSDSIQPLFYRLTSYWGGLDGSIMFWVFLLSVFGAIAVKSNRERHRELVPYVIATIAVVQMFFLSIMIVSKDPFATYLTQLPDDGRGLNPLLQNPYMVIHPPSLYTGLVAMTVPFAFGMAALITGYLDDSWLRAVRRWTMFSWFFLSLGLTLGMIWAYEELGWGGWWGWDPVENAGALPWFPATAFLHSVMVQERRSMLRVWNISLIIIAFALTLFATAMTRTGIVQSVHAFGEDPQLALMFAIFIGAVMLVSFGLVIYRLPLLRARNELESWASREAAFLANNWILLFSAFFILFATMFPTLSEAVTGQRITVGPPFFNKWMIPIGLMLLLLTGIGPLLAWRKSTLANLGQQFLWPAVVAVGTAAVLYALGFRVWVSGVCFALCGFVVGTVGQEFVRGAVVRRGVTGTDLVTAMIGLVMRSRRRYGGYVCTWASC